MYSNELVCNILEYINSNINEEISIDKLSYLFFFNRTYIMKRFKKELKISINEYINSMRIYNSLSLFKDNNYISSIGYKNGFNSLEYFSETFKKVLGVNPNTYKKYINRDINIKKEDIEKILININKLNNIKNNSIKYLNNRKPTTIKTKSLIFK